MGWFSTYCGLGNETGDTQHKVDALCLAHDQAYEQMLSDGQNPYWSFNQADEDFLVSLQKIVPSSLKEGVVHKASLLFATGKKILTQHNLSGIHSYIYHVTRTFEIQWS